GRVGAAGRRRLPCRRRLRAAARRRPRGGSRAPRARARARRRRSDHALVPRRARPGGIVGERDDPTRRGEPGRGLGPTRRGSTKYMSKRVAIVGGGFGGLHLVRHLEKHLRPGDAEVTLIDRQNYSLFTPLLYQVATGELPPHAVAYPLRLATALAGYRFIQTEIEAIDVERHVVRTADGDLPYDHVVVAPGSVTNDHGLPGVAEHAVAMKWLADGEAVRKRVIRAFEDAAIESDAAMRKQDLTFVLIGAG